MSGVVRTGLQREAWQLGWPGEASWGRKPQSRNQGEGQAGLGLGRNAGADRVERKAPSCGREPGAPSLGSTDLIYETAGGLSEGAGHAPYQMP